MYEKEGPEMLIVVPSARKACEGTQNREQHEGRATSPCSLPIPFSIRPTLDPSADAGDAVEKVLFEIATWSS